MEKRGPLSPNQRNYEQANELAFALACEQLSKIGDIEQQCHRLGALYQVRDSQQLIAITYLNQPYLVTFPQCEVSLVDSGDKVPVRDRVLILHYLTSLEGSTQANRLITYKELPGGNIYFPTFSERTIKPILKNFGKEPELLIRVAARLGGQQVSYGDVSVTVYAFSRVPITIVLWRGDDEFAPEGNILFDTTIADYLPTEDITVVCETVTWKLIRYLG